MSEELNFETCSENDLYFFIDEAGAFIWRMNHDMAHGRIPHKNCATIDKDIARIRKLQKEAVKQTSRFGINPFIEDDRPSEEYLKWYRRWKSYIDRLTDEEWKELQRKIENNEDYTMYHPDNEEKYQDISIEEVGESLKDKT